MSKLSALLGGFRSVSIVGLCKNAGKTTALNHITGELGKSDTALGLTSIGRDGESIDIVTGTKKPTVYVREGTLIATAQGLLPSCDITREIVENTRISTPMGDVIIVRALSGGYVQLAGPSMVRQLVDIKHRFFEMGAQKVIIDGAVSRKTLCSSELCEAAVLCAGASCGADMARVVSDTRHHCRILTLPRACDAALSAAVAQNPQASIILAGGSACALPKGAGLEDGLRAYAGVRFVYIPGAVSDALLRPIALSGIDLGGVTFVARDASRVLISPQTMEKLEIRGAGLAVLDTIELAAVTVNPFSVYGHHFGRRAFLAAMESALPVPVFDVNEHDTRPVSGCQCTE